MEDARPRLLQLAAATYRPVQPVRISLTEALGIASEQADRPCGPDGSAVENATERKQTRRQASARLSNQRATEGREEPRGCGQCPLYGDDTAIDAEDDGHVKAGCWAVDTINPNCWSRAATYMRLTAADFIGVQEMKVKAGKDAAEAEESAKNT